MSKARKSSRSKSSSERTEYYNNTIKRIEPTLQEVEEFDSTESTKIQNASNVPIGEFRTKDSKSILVKEGISGWLFYIVGALLLAIIIWGSREIYNLNREVGEMKINLNHLVSDQSKSTDDLSKDIDDIEIKMDREVNKINDKLEKLEGSLELEH